MKPSCLQGALSSEGAGAQRASGNVEGKGRSLEGKARGMIAEGDIATNS